MIDWHDWALPLHVEWGFGMIQIQILYLLIYRNPL